MRPHSPQAQAPEDTLDPLRVYLQQVRTTPLLTAEQEQALARRVVAGQAATARLSARRTTPAVRAALQAQLADGQAARQQLILANLRLVVFITRRYDVPGLTRLDLIQEGTLGLIRAAEGFDPTRGCRFSTYAAWWVRQAITQGLTEQARLIRLPIHITETRRAVRTAEARLQQTLGRVPTREEIAAATGRSVAQVQRALDATPDPCSLDQPLDDAGDNLALKDVLADPQMVDPQEVVERRMLREAMREALSRLSTRERTILVLHYGLDGDEGRTYEEIGLLLGVSRDRPRQIAARALARLRQVPALRAFLDLPVLPDHVQVSEEQPPARRLTRGVTATPPTLPAVLPPGLPQGFGTVLTALDGATTMEEACRRSSYSTGQFYHILAEARRTLGLAEGRRRRSSPAPLLRELCQALKARARSMKRSASAASTRRAPRRPHDGASS